MDQNVKYMYIVILTVSIFAGLSVCWGRATKTSYIFCVDEVNVCDIAQRVRELEKKDLAGGELRFSSLTSHNNKGHAIQSPPFVDFIKSYFLFNIGRKFNPPFLKGMIPGVS